MNFEEFIRPTEEASLTKETVSEEADATDDTLEPSIDLDIQKAVVESLAADKAEQDERIVTLEKENGALKSEITVLTNTVKELKAELEKMGDILAANVETELSNKISLLDRNSTIEDRFEGETRDHILEILKEARDAAEKDGRLRRAQLIESVLVDNVSSGNLSQHRSQLEKLFAENQNILSGPVINELDKLNIAYKVGENYLLPCEIIKRTF